MDSEILTITPVGGQPITVTAPANSAETPAEFAGRIGSACPIHLADLPIVEPCDMEGLVPNIVARFGDCLLVCYDGGGSMVMPECMAVDIDGVGWAIIGPPPAEWGGLDIDTAARAAMSPREGEDVVIERMGRALDPPAVRVTVADADGALVWGRFSGAGWRAALADAA